MSEINEELISAYLDHELTPFEREDVEAALAQSPELRQLRDELETLREDFNLLPVHHHQNLEQVLEHVAVSQSLQPGIANTPPKPLIKKAKFWMSVATTLAACLLAIVTMRPPPAATNAERLAMTDQTESSKNQSLEQQSGFMDKAMPNAAGEEFSGAMGGMGGGLGGIATADSVSNEPSGSGVQADVRLAKEPQSEASEGGFGQAEDGNLASGGSAPGTLAVQSNKKPDYTVTLAVSRNELTKLLEIIVPMPAAKPAGNEAVQAKSPQQRKTVPANAADTPADPQTTVHNPNARQAIAYAVEHTPQELRKVLDRLDMSKYRIANTNEDLPDEIAEKAKKHLAALLADKQNSKLQVLYLITLEPVEADAGKEGK